MDKLSVLSKKIISIFLMLVLVINFIIPSFAESDIKVVVTESDGQITLKWNDPDNSLFSRMKITGAGKTVYVDKGVQQAVFTDLINGVEYKFRLCMISNAGVILGETEVSGVPRDSTPPDRVTDAYCVPGDESVLLYWNDPLDEDLDRIRIKFQGRVIEVDKGVERLLVDGLDNGKEYRFVITAVDTSGNESDSVEITSVPGADVRIHLSGPGTVQSGQEFSVNMDVYTTRTDIYAVQIDLLYDAAYFRYTGYEEAESGIKVVYVDEKSEGRLIVYLASTDGKPVTGQEKRIITLNFKAGESENGYTGLFRLRQALAGTSSGDQIPVSSNSVSVTIASTAVLPEISDVKVVSGNGSITLTWTDPAGGGFDRVQITVNGTDVYFAEKGSQSITITGLINGEVYEFVLKTVDSKGNTSRGITVYGVPGIAGDVNFDGMINVGDLAVAAYNYLIREGDPGWEQAKRCDVYGINGEPDGIVDILDITFIANKILEQQ